MHDPLLDRQGIYCMSRPTILIMHEDLMLPMVGGFSQYVCLLVSTYLTRDTIPNTPIPNGLTVYHYGLYDCVLEGMMVYSVLYCA